MTSNLIEELKTAAVGVERELNSLTAILEAQPSCDMEELRAKHSKLFQGDLSKLDYGDRQELFESVHHFLCGDSEAHDQLSRIEARL